MRADTGVEDARRAISAAEQFTQPAYAESSEGTEIARALAVKLGCRRVGLIGCVRKPIISALRPQLEVVGVDAEPLVAQARELEPRGKLLVWSRGWRPVRIRWPGRCGGVVVGGRWTPVT